MSTSKEHILKTSFSLFLKKSFKEVTMNELVNASGLSKGAFYHYFPSKEHLFIEVVNTFLFEQMIIDYATLKQESLWDFYHDYADRLKQMLLASREFLNYTDEKENLNFLAMMFDALKVFPGFRERVREAQTDEVDAWTAVVTKARSNGEFTSPMSDEQIARMFIYSNDGIGLRLLLYGDLDAVDREMITLWDNFYREIKD
ncbi:MAG: TetR/AcrR family transcriptional regulator [Bacteroidetes bacterium]|nr:TetR/AcrR family transcriptional regulator [Bacteroidota bacterium]